MLNIFDVIRNIIAEHKIILPNFFYIKNLTGYHQCLLDTQKLEKLLPELSESLLQTHKKNAAGCLHFIIENDCLTLQVSSETIYSFSNDCEFVSPYVPTESLEYCEVETVDELVAKLESYSNQTHEEKKWEWQWFNCSVDKPNIVKIIPVNAKLHADFHADYYIFYPFLDSEIETILSSLATPKLNVFLADDSTVSLLTTKAMIENLGARVTTAADGKQALDMCRKCEFDVIILDEKMPKMFGSDVLVELKSNLLNRNSLKAILSGVTNKEEVESFILKGANVHLDKPVTKLKLQKLLAMTQQTKFSATQHI